MGHVRARAAGLGALILAALCTAGAAARAQDSSDEGLRREIEALKRKVEALEKAQAGGGATPAAGGGASAEEDEELKKLLEEAEGLEAKPTAPALPGGAPGSTAGSRGSGPGGFGGLQQTLNAFNPRITVFGDFVGRPALGEGELEQDDRASLREVELDFRADVDPYSKAVLILAAHEEPDAPGTYELDIEEGYVTLETLPWNFRAQIGRWRQRFGQANRIHQHDLLWVEYPWTVQDFLGDEGLIGDGVALMWLAPGLPLELEATVINGENESILAGADSDYPAFLGRASFFQDFPGFVFATLGSSYLHGFNDDGRENRTRLLGGDFMLTWRPTQLRSVASVTEIYYLEREVGGGVRNEYAVGWYTALQVQPIQQLYLGVRYDSSDYGEQIEDNDQWAASVYASYYTTEFLRFRVGYEHRERRSTGFPGAQPDLDTLFFQVTFVFGSHPVEPFWVNR